MAAAMDGPPILSRVDGQRLPVFVAPGSPAVAASRRFPPEPTSVAQARRFVLEQLPGSSRDRADELVLMVSELATNVVQHAAAPYVVSVAVDPPAGRVWVEVRDTAGGNPAPPEIAGDAPHGRGLHIVATLADAWGIDVCHVPPGTAVWFSASLPVPAPVQGGTAAVDTEDDGAEGAWRARDVREMLNGLSDAAITAEAQGTIPYGTAGAVSELGLTPIGD
jgi:hypothetical protein